MKNRFFKKMMVGLIALCFGAALLSGCNNKKPVEKPPEETNEPDEPDEPAKEEGIQLLSFESYEEITGTKIRLGNQLGKVTVNTDETYLTEGKGSMLVRPQGDYGNRDINPYIQFDCAESTFGTGDFTDIRSVSMDVYNNTDKELHITVNFTIANYSAVYVATPKITYTLAPKAWTECTYDVEENVVPSYFDLENVRYMTIQFMECKESKDDTENELYFDNLYGKYYDVKPEIEDFEFSFYDGVGFEDIAEQYLIAGMDNRSNRMVFQRMAYKDTNITADPALGEYVMCADVTDTTWPSFTINYGEIVPKNTMLTFWVYIDVENAPEDTFLIDSFTGSDPSNRVAHTVGGKKEFNKWFQVRILLNEGAKSTWSFFNFDDFETKSTKSRFGDKPVKIYLDNIKLERDVETVTEKDGVITLKNPLGAEGVAYKIDKPFKKGQTVAFDIDFNIKQEVTIWVRADGKWNAPGEKNEFYAYNHKTWDGKRTITAKIEKDVSFLMVSVKYFDTSNLDKNVCTISNIRTIAADVTVDDKNNITMVTPEGMIQNGYDFNMPVKKGQRITFDIDFDTDEPLAVWVLDEGELGKNNEFFAYGYGKWDGKKRITVEVPRDINWFQIRYEFRGKTNVARTNKCVISNLQILDPDVTVGADGVVTIKNQTGAEGIFYDINQSFKAGQVVAFDIDFNVDQEVSIWVKAEGKWNEEGVKNEYFAKNYKTWDGKKTITVNIERDISFLRVSAKYFATEDLDKNICTISNIRLLEADVTVDENNNITITTPEAMTDNYYDFNMPVKKGQRITFDIDFDTDEALAVWVLDEGKFGKANEFFVYGYGKWDGKKTITVEAPRDINWFRIQYQFRGKTNVAKKNTCVISDLRILDPDITVGEDGVITIKNQTGAEGIYYDINQPFKAGQTVAFDIDFNVNQEVSIWVKAEGKWNADGVKNEYFAGNYKTWDGKTTIFVNIERDISFLRVSAKYFATENLEKNICTISNIRLMEADVTVDENNNITIITPDGMKDNHYDFNMPVKKGGRITFDIDFDTNEALAVWVLDEGKLGKDNELFVYGYGSWNGKQRITVEAPRDIKWFQIRYEFRGKTNVARTNKCVISNLRVLEPDITVGEDGVVTIKNQMGAKSIVYNVMSPVKKGQTVSFNIDFNTTEALAIWVMADGKWNTAQDTTNEFFVQGYGSWKGKTQIKATATRDMEWYKIRVEYRGTGDPKDMICTISDLKIEGEAETPLGPNDVVLGMESGHAQNNLNRYLIYLNGLTQEQIATLGNSAKATVYIDGKEVSGGGVYYAVLGAEGSKVLALILPYTMVKEGAATSSEVGAHLLTIPAGMKIGDLTVTEDLTIRINNSSITADAAAKNRSAVAQKRSQRRESMVSYRL